MVGVSLSKTLVMVLSGLTLLQGCASTQELYAEYDNKFCVVAEHPSEKFRWEEVVYFESNMFELPEKDLFKLRINSETLKRLPEYSIAVKAYADPQGDDNYNEQLSKMRLESVVRYLVDELGIAENRIKGDFYGESLSVNQVGSALVFKDRRIEMQLLDTSLKPVTVRSSLAGALELAIQ